MLVAANSAAPGTGTNAPTLTAFFFPAREEHGRLRNGSHESTTATRHAPPQTTNLWTRAQTIRGTLWVGTAVKLRSGGVLILRASHGTDSPFVTGPDGHISDVCVGYYATVPLADLQNEAQQYIHYTG